MGDYSPENHGIGALNENSLHADLKRWYAAPGDRLEVRVDGYVIDLIHDDLLVEFQTRSFSAIRRKLERLLQQHPVRLVHPIASERWIVRQDEDGKTLSRRKSPRRGQVAHLFIELVRLPGLVANPNFSIEVLFTREEELRVNDGRGSWRRKGWSIADRRLLEVVERLSLNGKADYRLLLPGTLSQPFTTRELASAIAQPLYLAQKMAYCLRQIGVLRLAGKRGRSYLYEEDDL